MSPLSAPNPCPNLIKDGNFYFCGIYKTRPVECKNHEFYSRFCPIGLDVLKLRSINEVRERIDDGYIKCKELVGPVAKLVNVGRNLVSADIHDGSAQ